MANLKRNGFLLNIILGTMITTQGTEQNITTTIGQDRQISWSMDPIPPSSAVVKVLHPSGGVLFTALGANVLPAGTDLSDRVSNTGNTNTATGHIEFTLGGITVQDAGIYSTMFNPGTGNDITGFGVTLIVYVKPSKPVISLINKPIVGTDMNLKCSSASNSKPDGNNLQMTYVWHRNGIDLPSEDRYVISGSELQVKNIQKVDNGTLFTCQAYENQTVMSDISDEFTTIVEYTSQSTTDPTSDSTTDTSGSSGASQGNMFLIAAVLFDFIFASV